MLFKMMRNAILNLISKFYLFRLRLLLLLKSKAVEKDDHWRITKRRIMTVIEDILDEDNNDEKRRITIPVKEILDEYEDKDDDRM